MSGVRRRNNTKRFWKRAKKFWKEKTNLRNDDLENEKQWKVLEKNNI